MFAVAGDIHAIAVGFERDDRVLCLFRLHVQNKRWGRPHRSGHIRRVLMHDALAGEVLAHLRLSAASRFNCKP
jgi:hypothetical protein